MATGQQISLPFSQTRANFFGDLTPLNLLGGYKKIGNRGFNFEGFRRVPPPLIMGAVILGKRQSFATKKVLLEKSIKITYKTGTISVKSNKSDTILGNLPPICRKIVPIIRKKFKISHNKSLFI